MFGPWNSQEEYDEQVDFEDPPKVEYEFISREEWGAVPPRNTEELEELEEVPVEIVLIPLTLTKKCKSKESCKQLMRQMQKDDMDKGMPDIKNNFYVGGDGNVYEGRGWTTKRSKLEEDDFLVDTSITVAMTGNHKKTPSKKMILTMLNLVKLGIDKKYFVAHVWYNSRDIKYPI